LPPTVFLMTDVAACGTDYSRFVLVRDEPDLCRVIRERCAELKITYDTLDVVALLPDGYASKLLCEHPTKHAGALTLWSILGSLGYRIGLVHDEELLARFRDRLITREKPPQAQAKRRLTVSLTRDFLRKIGRKGGKRRAAIAREKKRRSAIYRRNALKRWHPPEITDG
jgi:hypothetical protein